MNIVITMRKTLQFLWWFAQIHLEVMYPCRPVSKIDVTTYICHIKPMALFRNRFRVIDEIPIVYT